MKKNKVLYILVLMAVSIFVFAGCSSGEKDGSKELKKEDVVVSWNKEDKSSLNENGGELCFTINVEDNRQNKENQITDIKICVELKIGYRNTDGDVTAIQKEETFDCFGSQTLRYPVEDLVDYNGRFLEGVICTIKSVSGKY